MLKRTISLLLVSAALFCALLTPLLDWPAKAQSKKPSQALRQVTAEQRRLLESFDRDVSEGRAQTHEWDARAETLRRFTAARAAEFQLGDWQDEELLALATLYQWAEQFPQAIGALRAYLTTDAKSRAATNARVSLARALIETEQLDEAAKLLGEMRRELAQEPPAFISAVALYKDLATALRDNGRLTEAADQAEKGHDLAVTFVRGEAIRDGLREAVLRDRFSLAALFVAISEKLNRRKAADDLHQLILKHDFKNQPSLRSFYEAELAAARLIGQPAPELVIARWLDAEPKKLSDLRGQVVLLDFWAMWCGPCIAAFPYFRELQNKYRDKGLTLIGVTRFYGRSDNEDELSREQEWQSLQNYKRRHKLDYPFAVGKLDDVTNEERYGVAGVPMVILIDRRGHVRHIKRGVGEYRKLERQITRLLDEQ